MKKNRRLVGDWYLSWTYPNNIPEAGLSPEERKHRDREDAQKLLKLTKQLAREECRLSTLRGRAALAQNGPLLVVISGSRNLPLDQLQYGVTNFDGSVTPVKPEDQFTAGRAAVQLADCYTKITQITEDIRALKATQEGAE